MQYRKYLNVSKYAALMLLISIPTGQAVAEIPEPSACVGTAWTMARACRNDLRDDFYTTKASCKNIAKKKDRNDCLALAAEEMEEAKEACPEQRMARIDVCDLLSEDRYDPDPLLDKHIKFVDPDDIPDIWPLNPYFSLAVGHTYVLRAGEDFEETVIVTVTDEIREINGVDCRVVVDAVVIAGEDEEEGGVEYESVEITDDYYAQSQIGDVYYCGEVSRNFEDDYLADLDGSFISGIEYAKAGTLAKVIPAVGDAIRQEFAPGEAEDVIEYVALAAVPSAEEGGDNPAFPCAPGGCVKTLDSSPLEPADTEFKYYIAGTGFVMASAMEDGEFTGEREELLCVGDSLDILNDEACGIEDAAELLDELCELSPDAFCP